MPSKLAEAFIQVRANRGMLKADLARVKSMLRGSFMQQGAAVNAMAGPMDSMNAQLNTFGKTATKNAAMATTAFAGFGKNLKAMAKGAAASLGIMAGGALLIGVIKTVATFEDAMADVRINARLLGEEGAASFARLEKEARRLGATTRFTATQAAQAMNLLAKAGLSVNEIISATAPILDLATAASLDLASTAEIVIRNAKIFGIEMSNLSRVSDTFLGIQSRTAASVKDVGDALSIAGVLGKKAGLSMEQMASMVGLMKDRAVSATTVGTALAIAFNRVTTETKLLKKGLDSVGIAMKDYEKANGEIDLQSLLEDMTDLKLTTSELNKIFGTRGKEMVKLFEAIDAQGRKGMFAANALAQALRDDVGFAAEAAALKMDTFLGKIKEMVSAAQELVISVLTPMVDALLIIIRPLTALARGFAALNESMGGLIGITLKWTAVIAAGSFVLGKLTVIIGAVKAAFVALRVVMLANPFTAILIVVVSLVAWLVKLGKAGKLGIFQGAFGGIVVMGQQVLEKLKEIWKFAQFQLSAVWGDIKESVLTAFNSIMSMITGNQTTWNDWGQFVSDIWHNFLNTVTAVIKGAIEVVAGLVAAYVRFVKFMMGFYAAAWKFIFGESLGQSIQGAFDIIKPWVTFFLDTASLLSTDWNLTWEAIKEGLFRAFLQMKNAVINFAMDTQGVILGSTLAIMGAFDVMGQHIIEIWKSINDTAAIAFTGIMAGASQLWTNIKKFFSGQEITDSILGAVDKAMKEQAEFQSRLPGRKKPESLKDRMTRDFKAGQDAVTAIGEKARKQREKAIAKSESRLAAIGIKMFEKREELRKSRMKTNKEEEKKEEEQEEQRVPKKRGGDSIDIDTGFVGIEELGRKIQESLLDKAKEQMEKENAKNHKDTAKNTEESAMALQSINRDGVKIKGGLGLTAAGAGAEASGGGGT